MRNGFYRGVRLDQTHGGILFDLLKSRYGSGGFGKVISRDVKNAYSIFSEDIRFISECDLSVYTHEAKQILNISIKKTLLDCKDTENKLEFAFISDDLYSQSEETKGCKTLVFRKSEVICHKPGSILVDQIATVDLADDFPVSIVLQSFHERILYRKLLFKANIGFIKLESA